MNNIFYSYANSCILMYVTNNSMKHVFHIKYLVPYVVQRDILWTSLSQGRYFEWDYDGIRLH